MLRIVLLISLLASLIFTISQFNSEQLPELPAALGKARSRPTAAPGNEVTFGQRPELSAIPEVYDGYLFNEERQLDEADFGEFGETTQETTVENAAGLEQVFYAGSVIVGDRRQGLITYQENNRSGAQPNRSSRFSARSRNVAVKPASETQYKVLKPGDRFLGYVVAAIEPDKIVFEKGGEKVEKFLYDQNKKRPEVSETPRATPSPAQAGVNGTVTAPPANISPNVGSGPGGSSPPSPTPFRRSIRSRRLPRYNPASRLPNLPVPSAPTASPNN